MNCLMVDRDGHGCPPSLRFSGSPSRNGFDVPLESAEITVARPVLKPGHVRSIHSLLLSQRETHLTTPPYP
jgi:hypothetical protein